MFAAAAVYALALLVPFWLLVEAPSLIAGEPPTLAGSGAATLLLLNGALHFASQALSFAVLCAVRSPVSAAVMSTFKRVVTIAAAVLWFRTTMTTLHAVGIGLAVAGVACYQDSPRYRSPEAATPHVSSLDSLALSPRRGAVVGSIGTPLPRSCCRAV